MCLMIHKEKTEKAQKTRTEAVKRYKIVKKGYGTGTLRSIFFSLEWKIGVNESNYDETKKFLSVVYEGIHVYVNEKDAIKAARDLLLINVILEVICEPSDLIAVGEGAGNEVYWQEAYKKVTVTEEAFNQALNYEFPKSMWERFWSFVFKGDK